MASIIKRYIAARQRRFVLLGGPVTDAAWDFLLSLFAAEIDGRRDGMPSPHAVAHGEQHSPPLWLERLELSGHVTRLPDPEDGGRTLLRLSPTARKAIQDLVSSVLTDPPKNRASDCVHATGQNFLHEHQASRAGGSSGRVR